MAGSVQTTEDPYGYRVCTDSHLHGLYSVCMTSPENQRRRIDKLTDNDGVQLHTTLTSLIGEHPVPDQLAMQVNSCIPYQKEAP